MCCEFWVDVMISYEGIRKVTPASVLYRCVNIGEIFERKVSFEIWIW